jgi:RimJ/RimL family protein N-acetyltransferase
MLTINLLADRLQATPVLTGWFRGQWPDYFASRSDSEMEQMFLAEASRGHLPCRLVASEGSELVGTIVLRDNGTETSPEFQPELGGLFVPECRRCHGTGTELVKAGMRLALDQGYETVFATTVSAARIFERLGWQFAKTVVHSDGPLSLYRCKL